MFIFKKQFQPDRIIRRINLQLLWLFKNLLTLKNGLMTTGTY